MIDAEAQSVGMRHKDTPQPYPTPRRRASRSISHPPGPGSGSSIRASGRVDPDEKERYRTISRHMGTRCLVGCGRQHPVTPCLPCPQPHSRRIDLEKVCGPAQHASKVMTRAPVRRGHCGRAGEGHERPETIMACSGIAAHKLEAGGCSSAGPLARSGILMRMPVGVESGLICLKRTREAAGDTFGTRCAKRRRERRFGGNGTSASYGASVVLHLPLCLVHLFG